MTIARPAGTAISMRGWVPSGAWRTALMVGGLAAVVVVPMTITFGVLHEPPWVSTGDVAQVELRVRDVGFDHPPLVGLPGRLRAFGSVGSHPGPLSFYALAPLYRALGADGWALQVSSGVLASAAAVLALWIGHRRGGWRFALAVAGTLAILLRSYGAWRLVDAWNPHLPLVWWFVFLLAVWSILCDDLPMMPVAVFAGSYCAQTHVPYLPLVGGIAGLTALALGLRWLGLRRRPRRPGPRSRTLRWAAVSVALAGALWLPPVIDQISNDPGNFAIIVQNFREPSGERVQIGDALDAWISRLDISALLTSDRRPDGWHPVGSPRAGVVSLGLWTLSAFVAWRRHGWRDSALVRLHLVVGTGIVLGLAAISGIVGTLWPYLMLWAWGTTALMALAIAWTALSGSLSGSFGQAEPAVEGAEATETEEEADRTPVGLSVPGLRWPRPTTVLLGLAALTFGVLFAVDAAHCRMPAAIQWHRLAALVDATLPALEEDPAHCGDHCRYAVTWSEPTEGYGMVAALERHGYDARGTAGAELGVGSHRVVDPDDADAVIYLAIGREAVAEATSRPEAREVAYVDPNPPDERADRRELLPRLVTQLRAEGYDDLAARLQQNPLSMLPAEPEMSRELQFMLYTANQYLEPAAVFLITPD